MAITFRAAQATPASSNANGSSVTPAIPTGTQAGDLMVMVVNTQISAVTHSTPAGWTLYESRLQGNLRLSVWTRRFVSGDTAPTVNFSGAVNYASGIAAFAGVDAAVPLNTGGAGSQGAGTSFSFPAFVTPLNDMALVIGGGASSGLSMPSGYSTAIAQLVTIGYRSVTAGTVAAASSGQAVSTDYALLSLSLRPAQTPTYRGRTDANGGNTFSAATSVAQPSETQIGDLLVAVIAQTTNSSGYTLPTGWTEIGTGTWNTNANRWIVAKRVATATGATTQTWTPPASSAWGIGIYAFSGSEDVDAIGTAAAGGGTFADTPSITTTVPDDLLLVALAFTGNAVAGTDPPTGMTAHGGSHTRMFSESRGPAGATGVRRPTIQGGGSTAHVAVQLALKPPSRQPKIRSVGTTAAASGTTIAASAPPNVQAGDLMLAAITWDSLSSPGTVTAPDGWTLVDSPVVASPYAGVYARIAGSSEPASYTWTWTTAMAPRVTIAAVDNGVLSETGGTRTTAASTWTFPSVTTTGGLPRLLLFWHLFSSPSQTATPPVGSVEIFDDATTQNSPLAYEVQPVPGATGSRTATISSGTSNTYGYVTAVYSNQPPTAPTLSPASGTEMRAPVTGWTHNDPDSDPQARWALVRKRVVV